MSGILVSVSTKEYPPVPVCRSALELDAAYLQGLFLCVNGTSQQDVAKLVQAAQLVLSSQNSAGELRMAVLTLVHLLAAIEACHPLLHMCP